MARKSTFKVVGTLPGSTTRYSLKGKVDPLTAAIAAAPYAKAWIEAMKADVPAVKDKPRPLPKIITLTIHLK